MTAWSVEISDTWAKIACLHSIGRETREFVDNDRHCKSLGKVILKGSPFRYLTMVQRHKPGNQ